MNNIEQFLKRDIGDMKRRARNYQYKGRKQRINFYMGDNTNIETVVYNMEKIIPYAEFVKLDLDMQKTYLTEWRNRFSNKQIMNELGTPHATYYGLLDKLGIEKKSYSRKQNKKTQTPPAVETVQKIEVTSGIYLELNGEYKSKDLGLRLKNLGTMIAASDGKYRVEIKITQN